MKFEKIGSISYKKGVLVGVILAFLLVVVINLFTSLAKYRLTQSVKIVDSVVSYSPYDFKIMEIYKQKEDSKCTDINGDCYEKLTSSERMPSDGYVLNTTNSHCELNTGGEDTDATLTSNEAGETVISGLTVKDKCYLYYDKEIKAGDTIVANSSIISESPHFDGTACIGDCTYQNENGLYKTQDDFGDTYYFRGTVSDNWVKFGNMSTNGNPIWWRIIRINGDGTIRLIYAGTGASAPGTTTSATNALTSQTFNGSYNDNRFVGYQYASSSGTKRGHESPSNAYTQLMSWFLTNLSDEFANGAGQIDPSAGFCGDRSSSTNSRTPWLEDGMSESGGTGKTGTYYGAYLRLLNSTKQPTLKCGTKDHKDEDYYTYTGAKGIKQNETDTTINGTRSLTSPVGLITADEVAFAGGVYGPENKNYWLYTNQTYWTMSPYNFYSSSSDSYASVFYVYSDGNLNYTAVLNTNGLRPVINLKADTKLTFEKPDEATKGTSDNPYIVVN